MEALLLCQICDGRTVRRDPMEEAPDLAGTLARVRGFALGGYASLEVELAAEFDSASLIDRRRCNLTKR